LLYRLSYAFRFLSDNGFSPNYAYRTPEKWPGR
jgi:hypothetical protein